MKKFRLIIIVFVVISLVSACGTIRKGFQPDKKKGEEFLVEKKSPLVMPPEFNKLPTPNPKEITSDTEKIDIKSIISGRKTMKTLKKNTEVSNSIEKLILKEIKKN